MTHETDSIVARAIGIFAGLTAYVETAGAFAVKVLSAAAFAFIAGAAGKAGAYAWGRFQAWLESRR